MGCRAVDEIVSVLDRYFSIFLGTDRRTVEPGTVRLVSSPMREIEDTFWEYVRLVLCGTAFRRGVISVHNALYEDAKELVPPGADPSIIFDPIFQQEMITLTRRKLSHLGDIQPFKGFVFYCTPQTLRFHPNYEVRQVMPDDRHKFMLLAGDERMLKYMWDNIYWSVCQGTAYGILRHGYYVSFAAEYKIPYMQDEVGEVLILTGEEYRGRGYGKSCVSAVTKAVQDSGRVPLYRVDENNTASVRTAKSLGYRIYSEWFSCRLVSKNC
ncbi:MAG: GNAT family N-acetyltransferase [Armatimonadetes bacterium]|nr:GNAT family N-acetyltransferase [Armatimonadota bacterium]